MPALGLSLILIAAGAIIMWAIDVGTVAGVDVHAIGAILFGTGILGVVLAMLFWMSFSPFGSHDVHEDVHLN